MWFGIWKNFNLAEKKLTFKMAAGKSSDILQELTRTRLLAKYKPTQRTRSNLALFIKSEFA